MQPLHLCGPASHTGRLQPPSSLDRSKDVILRACGSLQSVPGSLSSLCHQQCCVCHSTAPSWSVTTTDTQVLPCRLYLALLSQMLGWLWWSRKTWEGLSVRSEKHARNAVRDTLPAEAGMPLLAHLGLAPRYRCGCRKGSVPSTPRVCALRGCRVLGRSPAVATDTGQLAASCLGRAAFLMPCFDGKRVSLLP